MKKETQFLMMNHRALLPEKTMNGLQVFYDMKGKRNGDTYKNTLLDLSGNGRHATLHNFAYKQFSGYHEGEGLVFDGIDDKIVRPALTGMTTSNMTAQLNSNIISYYDNTVKYVNDGVIASVGQNLLLNSYPNVTNNAYPTKTFSLPEKPVVGETYTITLKGSLGEGKTRFDIYNSGGTIMLTGLAGLGSGIFQKTFQWRNFVDGYPVASDTHINVYPISVSVKTNCTIEWIKMEKGSTATTWAPHPNDLINTVELKNNLLGDMEGLIDPSNKTAVLSGTEIYTDKADADSQVHVDIEGKSFQNAGSGENLVSHLTLSNWTLSGGATIANNILTLPVGSLATTYLYWNGRSGMATYSWDTLADSGYLISTQYYDINGNLTKEGSDMHTGNSYAGNITKGTRFSRNNYTNWNTNIHKVKLLINASPTYTSTTIVVKNIAVRISSAVYEAPAPMPDYPIAIDSLNDVNVVSSIGRRNLIKNSQNIKTAANNTGLGTAILMTDEEIPYYRVTATGNTVSTYGFDGSSTASGFSTPMQIGETYTVSVQVRIPKAGTVGFYSARGTQTVSKTNEWVLVSFTYTYVENYRVIGLQYYANTIDYRNWKIEKGSIATNWVPAVDDILPDTASPLIYKTNLLLSEPLRSAGNVKDKLFLDGDGLWKVQRNVGEANLSSGYNYVFSQYALSDTYPDIVGFYARPPLTIATSVTKSSSACSHLAYYADTTFPGCVNSNREEFQATGDNWLKFSINRNRLTSLDVDGLKAWLVSENTKGTPVCSYYPLQTSVVEILSQDFQDRLNAIQSYANNNYVYTVQSSTDSVLVGNLTPNIAAVFKAKYRYKENQLLQTYKIWNRTLTEKELLAEYKKHKYRWVF